MTVARLMTGMALAAVVAVTGCSNSDSGLNLVTASKLAVDAVKRKPPAKTDPARMSRAAARALTKTDDPLMVITMPSVKASGLLTVIETNGEYRTWASWGRPDRRTVATKRGIITATRAVPPDLMSADVDGVLALVENRREGTAPYTQRYLDGNHHIVEAKSTCVVSRGYEKFVEFGEISTPALQMFSSCVSADRQFVDLFLVSDGGRIVQSRQWVGPVLGFATLQYLR